jgi:hypothetical protein
MKEERMSGSVTSVNSSGVAIEITFYPHGFLITSLERDEFYAYRMITSIQLHDNSLLERNNSLVKVCSHGNIHQYIDLGPGAFRNETFRRLRNDWHECVTSSPSSK